MSGIEGSDGRLYYNYGLGAEYRLYQNGREVTKVRIVDCIYDYRSESEKYVLESEEQPTEMVYEKDKLERLLTYGEAEETDCGVAQEYPLMKEEVRLYYEFRSQARTRERNEAEKYMEGTTGYKALKKQCTDLGNLLAQAITEERETVEILLTRYKEVKEKLIGLIESKGKKAELFEPERKCPECKGRGLRKNGTICNCAREQEKAIKQWNAEERLKKRFGATWAVRLGEAEKYGARVEINSRIARESPAQIGNGIQE